MKKVLSLFLSAVLAVSCFTACSSSSSSSEQTSDTSSASQESTVSESETKLEGIDIRIAGMKGPTSIGMVSLLDNSQKGNTVNNYEFTLAGAADEITPKLIKGELDIAAVPANLASVLYNNTDGAVKLLAVNTLGVLYIVEQGKTITSLEDLKGKTIYATGKGTTPEYALKYLLSQKGIDPETEVTFEWKSEATEIVAALKQDPTAIAMLPQPYVTVAQTQIEGLNISLDLNEEWNNLDNGSMLVTGVLVARSEFVEQNPDQIAAFLEEYKASTDYANENVEETAQLVESFDIFQAAVAQKAIPYCNIAYMEGEEMKTAVSGYLQTLYDQNPQSVGGNLPSDDFYYEK